MKLRNPFAAAIYGAADPVLLAKDLGFDPPDPWQIEMLRSNRKRIHVNIHRQGGKSTTCAVLALHQALFFPNTLTLIISPTLKQSQELFRKVIAFYRLKGKPVAAEQENQLSLTLENGSRIEALPGTEGTIRGYSPQLVIIDEGARLPDEVFTSILPMVRVTKGRVIALSTPAGKRGWFYDASYSLRWQHFRVTGYECPRLTAEELEEDREILGDLAFRCEYLCEYVDGAGAAFSGDDVTAMFSGTAPEPAKRPQPKQAEQRPQSRDDARAQRQMNRIVRQGPQFNRPAGTCRHNRTGRCVQCAEPQARGW